MEELPESQLRLTDGLKRALDSFLAHPEPDPPTSKVRTGRIARLAPRPLTSNDREAYLSRLITTQLGEGRDLALAAARINGDPTCIRRLEHTGAHLTGVIPVGAVLMLLTRHEAPDTLAIARRVVEYITGPPRPLWQYIAVSVTPAFSVKLYDGWEVAPIDFIQDESLPLREPEVILGPYSSEAFHFYHNYGAMRRPSGPSEAPIEESGNDDRNLVLPLLVLNLASDHPVHVGVSYYIEPGKGKTLPPGLRSQAVGTDSYPKEIHHWDYTDGQWAWPRQGRILSASDTNSLSRFAPHLGARVLRLNHRQREQLIRAADQYLIVVHRTPGSAKGVPALPSLHQPEAAFRWISAIEGLLTTDDTDRSDLKRKTAQRAAILVGENDDDRLEVRDLIKTGYDVRSSYAHGSKPKDVNLAFLRTITRKIIISWIILSAETSSKELPILLDEALLSNRKLTEITQRLSQFWDYTSGS